MPNAEDDQDLTPDGHVVVVNEEEQYSIWPAGRSLPPGWAEVAKRGTRAECLAYIEEIWTDIRPLSVRRRLAAGS